MHVDEDKQAENVQEVEGSISEPPVQESTQTEEEDKIESRAPIQEIKEEESGSTPEPIVQKQRTYY